MIATSTIRRNLVDEILRHVDVGAKRDVRKRSPHP